MIDAFSSLVAVKLFLQSSISLPPTASRSPPFKGGFFNLRYAWRNCLTLSFTTIDGPLHRLWRSFPRWGTLDHWPLCGGRKSRNSELLCEELCAAPSRDSRDFRFKGYSLFCSATCSLAFFSAFAFFSAIFSLRSSILNFSSTFWPLSFCMPLLRFAT